MPSCDVTVGGVDRSTCLAFRVRAFPRESFYGSEVQPSDWSPVTQWRAGEDMGHGCGGMVGDVMGRGLAGNVKGFRLDVVTSWGGPWLLRTPVP